MQHGSLHSPIGQWKRTSAECTFERVDTMHIELRPGAPAEFGHRIINAEPCAIRPSARHRVKRIRDGADARFKRNAIARQCIRRTGSIKTFMMRTHYG